MPFDGLYMRRVLEEINDEIRGPLRNVYQPTKVDYYLQFQDGVVRISLNPTMAYIAMVPKMKNPSQMPPSFTMLLRKHLKNARFLGVEQDGFARVATFKFRKLDEKGDERTYFLVAEIMGKHSNLILVSDEGKVVDAHRRIVTGKGRELIPGRWFVPFRSEKLNPMEVKIEELFPAQANLPLERYLVSKIEGMSRVIAQEIISRAGLENLSTLEMKPTLIDKLSEAFEDFKSEYMQGDTYLLVSEVPVDISCIVLHHTGFRHERMGPSKAAFKLFSHKEEMDVIRNKRRDLERVVVREIEKLENAIEKIEGEMERVKDYEMYRKYGEMLMANAFGLDTSSGKVKLVDWESEGEVEVNVDPSKDALENAKEYFDRYKKYKKKYEGMVRRLRELRDSLDYLYQLWQTVLDAPDEGTLEEIRREMEEVGLLKPQKRKTERKSTGPRKIEYRGFVILVGKNNRQNDELVRSSSASDVWLHARGIPGAHVVIRTGGREVPEDVLKFAASLAAGYSRGRDSGKVPVDYTLIRYVRKPKGFKPGMVIYTNQKTLVVEPRRIDHSAFS